jgi:hypothetical protein
VRLFYTSAPVAVKYSASVMRVSSTVVYLDVRLVNARPKLAN